ncbi:hypothetical protein FB451DRAFT_1326156 [Mycena latifolia]|nr:hypothetical protein FB451DRAFT_1326156 [Mycena latifolia]
MRMPCERILQGMSRAECLILAQGRRAQNRNSVRDIPFEGWTKGSLPSKPFTLPVPTYKQLLLGCAHPPIRMGSFAERLAEPLHAARTTQYPSMSTDTHLINRDFWHTASTGNVFFCEGALPLLASTTCASVSMCTPMPPGNNPVALDGMFCSEEGMMGDSLVYSQLPPSPTSSNITQWSLGVSILIAIVVTNWLPHVLWKYLRDKKDKKNAIQWGDVYDKWAELQDLLEMERSESQRVLLQENKLVEEARSALLCSITVAQANLMNGRENANEQCDWKGTWAKLAVAIQYIQMVGLKPITMRTPSRRWDLEATASEKGRYPP